MTNILVSLDMGIVQPLGAGHQEQERLTLLCRKVWKERQRQRVDLWRHTDDNAFWESAKRCVHWLNVRACRWRMN